MGTEIKNTLFRFITMRAPETVSKANKSIGFIFHPDLDKEANKLLETSNSYFKENINNPKESTELQFQVLQSKIVNFPKDQLLVSIYNLKEIVTENFLDFVNDFSKIRKETLRKQTMSALITSVPKPLDSKILVILWDNLFYQIITQKNASLRDSIMHVLIANHNLNKTDVKGVGQIVKTSVVIPPRFYGNVTSESGISKRSAEIANKPDQEVISRMHKNLKVKDAQKLIDLTLQAKAEVERLEKNYIKDENLVYSKKYKEYQTTIKELYKNAKFIENKSENKTTGEIKIKKEYIDLEIPEFDYYSKDQINQDNYNESIGDLIFKIADYKDIQDCENYEDVYRLFRKIISDANNIISANETTSNKVAVIAGVPVYSQNQLSARNGNYFNFTVKLEGSTSAQRPVGNNKASDGSLINNLKTPYNSSPILNRPPNGLVYYWNHLTFIINNLVPSDILSNTCHFENLSNQTLNVFEDFNFESFLHDSQDIESYYSFPSLQFVQTAIQFVCKLELADGTIIARTTINVSGTGGPERVATGTATFIPNVIVNPPNGNTGTGTTGNTGTGTTGTGTTGTGTTGTGSTGNTNTNPPALTFIPSRFGIKNLGVADYRKVEQEVCCYEPGEVSHIENIMAREYKEKSTERTRTTDVTTSTSSERETENLTDTTSATRNEMHSEVAQVIREETQIGVDANYHYDSSLSASIAGVGSIGINSGFGINANYAHSTSQEDSTNQAVTFAQDITQRAMERVVAKIKTEKISKVVETYKENNKHGFDNTKGEQHVSGVYRWINKVYNNQIVNYGKRAMIEFMLPEPARFHLLASIKNTGGEIAFTMEIPLDPRSTQAGSNILTKFDDVSKPSNPDNYKFWAAQFGIEIEKRPEQNISVGKSFSSGTIAANRVNDGQEYFNANESFRLPEGYYTKSAAVVWAVIWDGDWTQEHGIGLAVGNVIFRDSSINFPTPVYGSQLLKRYEGEIPISVFNLNSFVFSANVSIDLELSEDFYESWQVRTYNAIITAYEEKMLAYQKGLEASKIKAKEMIGTNQLYFRQIERNALKKNIMHYLVDDKYLGKNYIQDDLNLIATRPINNQEFDTNAAIALFMEQAFEWNIISYTFYPYYWGASARWKTAYNYQFDDALFTNFLQAGMARVVLTVRPGFEKTVNWYMATGQVWNGGQVPTLGEDLFLSLDQELKETEPKAEGLPWKTKLPSDLTVIQSSSIGLEADGLPCGCPTTEGGAVNLSGKIKANKNLIGGPTTTKVSGNPVVVGVTK